ncbi:LOW QUALITY PROTEIN: uncharacterized protein LJ206_019737 [Theristicus caerulescens]
MAGPGSGGRPRAVTGKAARPIRRSRPHLRPLVTSRPGRSPRGRGGTPGAPGRRVPAAGQTPAPLRRRGLGSAAALRHAAGSPLAEQIPGVFSVSPTCNLLRFLFPFEANPETSSPTAVRTADGLRLVILLPKQHRGSQKHLAAEGERRREPQPSTPTLQLLYAWDPLPAGAASAMEGEADNQRSVLSLMAVFEEHWASKLAWRDKQAPHGQTTPAASQPQQLPASPASQSLSQMAARHQAKQDSEEEEEEEEQQGQRGLSFKCLRSFRHKIREDNWRRQQDPGLEPGSKIEPFSPYRNQRKKKIALELLETEQAYVNRLHLLDQAFSLIDVPVSERKWDPQASS